MLTARECDNATLVLMNMFCLLTAVDGANLLVKTNSGLVLGHYIKSYEGRIISAFEGIPYARPPIGSLRFMEAEPVPKWTNILSANNTYTCLQYSVAGEISGSEDCLHLNVYVPRLTITAGENIAVVVGLHSGGYMRGDPHSLVGAGYLMDREVVYVSITYRLSMFGFLSTEDDVVPGNNGLKDQVMALQWIKDNIHYFGGHPKSITLVGVSAGASSIHLLYLSPMSKDLFNRGISLSGTALLSWVLSKNPAKYARKLARIVHCPERPSQLMVDCLRRVDAKTLISTVVHFYALPPVPLPLTPFGPVIEKGAKNNAFLSEHPYKLLASGKIKNAPWITSNVLNEGLLSVEPIVDYDKVSTLDREWDVALTAMIDCNETVADRNKKMVASRLREFYLNNETLSMDNIYDLVSLFGDRMFEIDGETAFRLHAKMSKSPVYYYYFTYVLEMRASFPDVLKGVSHMDDSRLIFPVEGNPAVLSENDGRLKDLFIDFVSNFASGKLPTFAGILMKPIDRNPIIGEELFLHINGPDDIREQSITQFAPRKFWDTLPIEENAALFKTSTF